MGRVKMSFFVSASSWRSPRVTEWPERMMSMKKKPQPSVHHTSLAMTGQRPATGTPRYQRSSGIEHASTHAPSQT